MIELQISKLTKVRKICDNTFFYFKSLLCKEIQLFYFSRDRFFTTFLISLKFP